MIARHRNQASRVLGRGRLAVLMIAIAITVILVLDRTGWLLVAQTDDLARYHGSTARVSRVIDGDTLDIALGDTLNDAPDTRIRLWGIDCPEVGRFGAGDQPWSREAASLAGTLLDGRCVVLFLEPHQQRDSFGRVLAHIEIADGENASRSLNEALLEAGLAKADDRWPHTRLTRYAQVETAARRRGVGIWSRPSITPTPARPSTGETPSASTAPPPRAAND